MALVKSRGVVLRNHKLGETSKVTVCYTEDYGKVRLVVKGGRKGGGRFGAALEPLMVSGVVFYLHEGRELSLLSQADIETEHPQFRRDVVRMAYGSAALEFVDRLVPGREADAGLFALIVSALDRLAEAPEDKLDLELIVFELEAARRLGYVPELSRCVLCGGPPGVRPGFSSGAGGAVCASCIERRPDVHAPAGPGATLLVALAAGGADAVAADEVGVTARDRAAELLREFLEAHTGGPMRLRSTEFLAQVRRTESTRDAGRDDGQ